MTSIAMKMKVGTAAGAIALATSLPAVVAPASAAPVPMPAFPVQIENVSETPFVTGGLFGGGVDLLALLNKNNNGPVGMSTIWNPVQFFFTVVHKIIALF